MRAKRPGKSKYMQSKVDLCSLSSYLACYLHEKCMIYIEANTLELTKILQSPNLTLLDLK